MSLISCKTKFVGGSEEQFQTSKIEILKELSIDKQENLEIALRVLTKYSIQEKNDHYGTYWDTSTNKIKLNTLDNKTYDKLIKFAEDFIKKENEEAILKIENTILELQLNRKNADSIITILNDFKPNKIYIKKYKLDAPSLIVKIVNKGNLGGITSFMFDIEIYSISQDRIIESIGLGYSNLAGISKGIDDYFTTLSRTLTLLTRKSKRFVKQIEQAESPIYNLNDFDLRVKITPSRIELANGTNYVYPDKVVSQYDTEIRDLQECLKQLKSLNGTLNEFVLQEIDSKKEIAYNEEFLPILKEIRSTNNKNNVTALNLSSNISINLPAQYQVINKKLSDYYSISLCNTLSFDIYDENLIQYQIKDTLYVEFDEEDDKANGVLNVLEHKNISCTIEEIIDKFIDSNIYKPSWTYKLIEHDDSGYLYFEDDRYKFVRYFKLNNTHYCYDMDFNNLKECVLEFERSKSLIK